MHEISDKNIRCGYSYYGDELNPNGMKTPAPDPFNKKGEELSKQPEHGFPPFRELVDNDIRKSKGRNIGVVNKLDAQKNNINADKLTKFMGKHDDFSGKEKGPDYIVFDNL